MAAMHEPGGGGPLDGDQPPAREEAAPEEQPRPEADEPSVPDADAAEEPVAGDEPAVDADDPAEALAAARRERDEYLDALRRERAEFENFRKRTIRERTELVDRGSQQLMASLLDVLDSFELALTAAERSEDEGLAKGVVMVHEQLLGRLRAAGVEEVPGAGSPFDPELHEAVIQVDAAEELGREVDEPTVAEVLRTGYRFKGRTLRPAAVKVAK